VCHWNQIESDSARVKKAIIGQNTQFYCGINSTPQGLIPAGRYSGEWQTFYTATAKISTYYLNNVLMRSLLYFIAVVLLIGWLLGVFVYSATGLIHVLIVIAIISLLLGVIRRA